MSSKAPQRREITLVKDPKASRADAPLDPEVEIPDYSCIKCLDTGMEIVPEKGARPCSCRKKTGSVDPFSKVRVPVRYSRCHFNNYDPKHPSQEAAAKFAMKFTQEYPAVDKGLLLTGPVGVGKTHLAVSILKGLTERGFPCLFYEFGSLLKEIQDSYNLNTKTSELAVLSPVLNTGILVLDELGASKPTDWVRDTMAYVINHRYNQNRATIFTTNYPDVRSSDKEETLEDRIGTRLRSRLFEMCRTVEISGRDHRRSAK
jgi:DNA replication protein DnaC